jgi:ABC-2 type transport system ATP-binding protein
MMSRQGITRKHQSVKIEGTGMNAIETDGVTRAFGKRIAVDDLTLAIPEGTVFGFLGPNGAGKTTTVRLLAALRTRRSAMLWGS